MNLLELRNVIIAGLAADPRLAGARVIAHVGEFDEDSLRRYEEKAPFVAVALLRVNELEWQGDNLAAECTFAAVCVTKNTPEATPAAAGTPPGNRRDANCIRLADAVMRSLAVCSWWSDDLSSNRPQQITARNMHSTQIDKAGIALWAVAWRQTVDITDDPADMDDFGTLHVEYDIAPRDNDADLGAVVEAEDDIDLT